MKMVNSRNSFSLLLLFFLTMNSILLFYYIIKLSNGARSDQIESNKYLNKLTLDLEVMDIYRLDISCDYITQALSQKISTYYMNSKKCSFSSLNSQVNNFLISSFNETNQSTAYHPIYNSKNTTFDPFSTEDLQEFPQFKTLNSGGYWVPTLRPSSACNYSDLDFLVFIVPYSKSRHDNLKLFLLNMHSYLQNVTYKFKYRIIVAEQEMLTPDQAFNKGRLINRAIKYATSSFKQVDCLIIHDVDLVPSNEEFVLKERGDYRCRQMPWHMSNEVYSLARKESRVYNRFLTGGILSLRPGHFHASNGFSNMYNGWGAEVIFNI